MGKRWKERKTYRIRRVGGLHSRAVKEESHGAHRLSLALAKGSHQLLQLGGALNLEEDFVVVVGDLDVEVLDVGGSAFGLTTVVVGHFWMNLGVFAAKSRLLCGFPWLSCVTGGVCMKTSGNQELVGGKLRVSLLYAARERSRSAFEGSTAKRTPCGERGL